MVQRGNPNIYSAAPPREAFATLKDQLTERFNERIREADVLVDVLTPIYESAEKSGDLEVAYMIKGRKNIVNRMKALVETARKELCIFISYPTVLRELKESLIEAGEKRGVKVNVAVTREVFKNEDLSGFGELRLLCCSCDPAVDARAPTLGMLISDMKTLVTLSNWFDEIAMLTQDQSLIRVCRDYYDNPACCTRVKWTKKERVSSIPSA
jgi:hypothetical protein